MNYWLVKSESFTYSWEDLVRDKKTRWDGVRNYAARNHLRSMKTGDLVLFYHSMSERRVIGIAKVVKEHYPDPGSKDPAWLAVDMAPVEALPHPVELADIKKIPALKNMKLIKIPRLSVQPVSAAEFALIKKMGKK